MWGGGAIDARANREGTLPRRDIFAAMERDRHCTGGAHGTSGRLYGVPGFFYAG